MTPKVEPLTDAEAEAMLARLSAHYRMPVMPIARYCAALRTWQGALYDRVQRIKADLYPKLVDTTAPMPEQEAALALYRAEEKCVPEDDRRRFRIGELRAAESMSDAVDFAFMSITKSALLDRLLYRGESLRSRMCPKHKGKWSGIEWGPENACPHGCQLTGWLPEPAPPVVEIVMPKPEET